MGAIVNANDLVYNVQSFFSDYRLFLHISRQILVYNYNFDILTMVEVDPAIAGFEPESARGSNSDG